MGTKIWFALFPFFHLLMNSLMGVPMTLLFGLQSAYLAELQKDGVQHAVSRYSAANKGCQLPAGSLMLQVQLLPFS